MTTGEDRDKVCTGCGRKLPRTTFSFDSIPGGVFCARCYSDIIMQQRRQEEDK